MKINIFVSMLLLILIAATLSMTIMIPSVFATSASITISPNTTTAKGNYFTLNITINNVTDMYGWEVWLKYRAIIDVVNVTQDTTLFNGTVNWSNDTQTVLYEDYAHYVSFVYGYLLGNVSGVSGSGVVANMNFTAIYNGTTNIKWS